MATGKSYYARPGGYRFLSYDQNQIGESDTGFELDESDFYNSGLTPSDSSEFRKPVPSSGRKSRTPESVVTTGRVGSLPVNVPDWSKILKDEYKENQNHQHDFDFDFDYSGDELDSGDNRVPPHEFLARQMARTRIASFSVHEGIGRTLKGRDLRRVRNAIFEKTGFQD